MRRTKGTASLASLPCGKVWDILATPILRIGSLPLQRMNTGMMPVGYPSNAIQVARWGHGRFQLEWVSRPNATKFRSQYPNALAQESRLAHRAGRCTAKHRVAPKQPRSTVIGHDHVLSFISCRERCVPFIHRIPRGRFGCERLLPGFKPG